MLQNFFKNRIKHATKVISPHIFPLITSRWWLKLSKNGYFYLKVQKFPDKKYYNIDDWTRSGDKTAYRNEIVKC